ncbi:MAG: peptidoglycan-binding protein [Alphaproteobacteria bacterium]|nr:peptidoglycan-binding protein [Alphaproteobacteria bacterium]
MATVEFTPELAKEYEHLFALATIRLEHKSEVDGLVDRILKPENFSQYEQVTRKTGVPAQVIGAIHSLETGLRFDRHLHNGDPLTARTVHVPAGRPESGNPPFQWFDSAVDALTMHGLDRWTDWSVAGIAFVLERYNGFGYRLHHPHVKSPYLWSFTTIYTSGRYVADHRWSDTAVSRQCGGMALIKRMMDLGKLTITAPPPPADDTMDVEMVPRLTEEDGAVAPLAAPPPYPGHALRLDSTGDGVRVVQERLTALGMSTGGVDGDFGDRTEDAVRLFQARTADETGEALEVDGVVGRQTWQALFGMPVAPTQAATVQAGSLMEAVLRIADGEVGVREVPLGSNRGPRVDQYLNAVGPGLLGQPWCMAFVYFCFGEAAAAAGEANPAPRTAGVLRSWHLAHSLSGGKIVTARQAAEDPSLVRPGMIFYISTGGGHGHAGFVADVVDGRLMTIEGNTNDNGSREGIGVFRRNKRRIRDISLGFAAFVPLG